MAVEIRHKFISLKTDSSDLSLVNPTNWNDIHTITGLDDVWLEAPDFNFIPQAPGGNLTAGITNTITLNPVPDGVNGSDINHYLWITGGTGNSEAVLITGGTAIAGYPNGTLTFVPANNHTGAWTISSACGGVKEAMIKLGTQGGTIIIAPGITAVHAPIIVDSNNSVVIRGSGRDSSQLMGDLNVSPVLQFGDPIRNIISYSSGVADLSVNRVDGTIPIGMIGILFAQFTRAYAVDVFVYKHWVGIKTDGNSLGLSLNSVIVALSTNTHLWLKDMVELYANNVEFGFVSEVGPIIPTYLVQISGITGSIQAVNCRFVGPIGAAPYAFGFTNLSGNNEFFYFSNCNTESINTLVYSDANSLGIGGFSWFNSRITGNAGAPAPTFALNANTQTTGWTFSNCGIGAFSSFALTNSQYLNISNSTIVMPITITGGIYGSCIFFGNVVSGTVVFTGQFNDQLFIGYNNIKGGILNYSGVLGKYNIMPNVGDDNKSVFQGPIIASIGPNFIPGTSETGTNNAIAASLPEIITQVGLILYIQIAHTLQAGGNNSLNFNNEGPVAIVSHYNGTNISIGYTIGAVIQLIRVTGSWMDMSQ